MPAYRRVSGRMDVLRVLAASLAPLVLFVVPDIEVSPMLMVLLASVAALCYAVATIIKRLALRRTWRRFVRPQTVPEGTAAVGRRCAAVVATLHAESAATAQSGRTYQREPYRPRGDQPVTRHTWWY